MHARERVCVCAHACVLVRECTHTLSHKHTHVSSHTQVEVPGPERIVEVPVFVEVRDVAG